MSRYQAIENALMAINPDRFQELCDSFLALRNSNYSAYSRSGSQSGKQKTTKGTPDCFFLMPNGKYLFVEHSTNITEGVKKLKKDITKCFNSDKTKIPLNLISEIILCVNFKLSTEEVQALNDLVSKKGIQLTIYTLDSLALELHLQHRDLTHEYLDLPLDTGQIVSIERFIKEYNRASKGISTPLDNDFMHREKEMEYFKNSIPEKDLLIVTGSPGVGKTKLVLEGIKSFLSDNLDYNAYCISYKNHTLLDDLYQYFDTDKNYLLFVDDANRIDAFNQIIGFYKAPRNGELKIILTVRDYAFPEIVSICHEFSPKKIDLQKLTDPQIIDIIKSNPFNIVNTDYHHDIVRIADGNPRLAIMTALLAIAKQDIFVLYDVSDLFENYFSTFIKDDNDFADKFKLKCLGIIAFFYTIPYKDKHVTESILGTFGISYSQFIDAIDRLDKLELIEIQFDHVKIPEQNLSTYFFYRTFIKDDLMSFESLLEKYFDDNDNRFRDCVIPANNTFGFKNVMNKLQPHLRNYWVKIKDQERLAFKYLQLFWFYLRPETMFFAFNLVEGLPDNPTKVYEVKSERNTFSYSKDRLIELLGEFFRVEHELTNVLELSFEYVRKKPDSSPELIQKLRESFLFDRDDEYDRFLRQKIFIKFLVTGLGKKDHLCATVFFALAKSFLGYSFRHTKGGRHNTIYMITYTIPLTTDIKELRKSIWGAISSNFDFYPKETLDTLCNYTVTSPEKNKEIMEYDLPFIEEIISKHLKVDSFEHCRYVHDVIRCFNRNSIANPLLAKFKKEFTNQSFEMFCKMDGDRIRNKDSFEFKDYAEFQTLKEKEIRTSFVFNTKEEIKEFYNRFIQIRTIVETNWHFNPAIDFIIDENYLNDFQMGNELICLIMQNNNEINLMPRLFFVNNLNDSIKAKKIWETLQMHEFNSKALWELAFFYYLDVSLINSVYVNSLVNTISKMEQQETIMFDLLNKYLTLEPKLFKNILKKIVQKNEQKPGTIRLWIDAFTTHFQSLGNDIELIKKAYIQQVKMQKHWDYEGNGLQNILKVDSSFLLEFVNSLYDGGRYAKPDIPGHVTVIWDIENIEPILKEAFNVIVEKEDYYGVSNHFCNSFFWNLTSENKLRAKAFIVELIKENYRDIDKMNVIIDLARHSMKEYYEEIVLLHVSLIQDVQIFSKISWRGNGTSGTGDVILSDIEAADWKNILNTVDKSDIGLKLTPLKMFLNAKIEYCLKCGDDERKRRYLRSKFA